MNYLHPGLVTGFVQEDPEYVIVSTDDGDTRDVHFDQIRFLPNSFSTLGTIYMLIPTTYNMFYTCNSQMH